MRYYKQFLYAFLALLLIMCLGIFFYIRVEGMTFIKALWLTVASISTVGFGDVVPATTAGRLMTIVLIFSGVGLFTFLLGNVSAALVEGRLIDFWGRKRMDNKINNLQDHIILCGAGRVGGQIISHLKKQAAPFVVVERDEKLTGDLHAEGKILFLTGDATDDKLLLAAGIKKARSVITTLADDAGNLFITVSCRDLNPGVRVVSRANRPESVLKLKRAGADVVVCPSSIAGSRMLLAATKPASVAYVESLMEEQSINLELEELLLGEDHLFAGKMLKNSGIREKYQTLVLAIRRGENIIINPEAGEMLNRGDILILCGPPDKLSLVERKQPLNP